LVFYNDAGLQRTVRNHIDFYLVNLPGFDPETGTSRRGMELDIRLAELTSFYSVFSFHMPLVDLHLAASVDAALAAGTKDFCLIQTYGHVFHGYDQLSYAMKDAMDRCGFITGRLMADGPAAYLQDGCILVNRHAWEKLGRPAYGTPASGDKTLTGADGKPAVVSGRFGHGWNAVSASYAAGIPVQPWPETISRFTWHCDAHGADLFEWLTGLDDLTRGNSAQDAKLKQTIEHLRNIPDRADAPKKVFAFNSENDAEFPQLRYRPGLDTAFVLASGFKANRILETFGFHDRTKVVTYDYSTPALALRKMTIEEWDGNDFATFFARARPRIEAQMGQAIAYVPHEIMRDPAAVAKEFQREMGTVFASADQWRTHWQRFRALQHEFVEVDVLGAPADAKAMLENHAVGNAVLWISDMFNSPNAVGKLAWNRRHTIFQMLSDTLHARATSDLILGGAPALWLKPQAVG